MLVAKHLPKKSGSGKASAEKKSGSGKVLPNKKEVLQAR